MNDPAKKAIDSIGKPKRRWVDEAIERQKNLSKKELLEQEKFCARIKARIK